MTTIGRQKLIFFAIFFLNTLLFLFFLMTNSYPFYAVGINLLSIITLWVGTFSLKSIIQIRNKRAIDLVLIICLFLFAFTVYLYKIDVITPGVQGDEITIAKVSEQVINSSNFVPFLPFAYGHPTPLLYLTGISISLFGRSVMALRLPYILFGAMSIAGFYVLLRLFFQKAVSFCTALLMLFSYPLIIVSRLAYEVTPSIFFQILTAIFLYLAWKTKDIKFYVAVGLSIGAGVYTYLGFRTFALSALLLCTIIIWKSTLETKEKIQRGYILLVVLFITTVPLLSYSFFHINDLISRTNAVSIFNQNLSPTNFVKETQGNIVQLSHLFFFDGDPNVRNNPSAISMFDKGTLILFLIGLFYIYKKNKVLFLLLLFFSISPIINDILTLEKIPEFHYYGQGHPNTLRIAGIIPIIYFSIAYGFDRLKPLINSIGKEFYLYTIYAAAFCIIFFNWLYYYNQPFNGFVYNFNGAIAMNVVTTINNSQVKDVAVSPKFLQDDGFKYFINRDTSVKVFSPKNYADAIRQINNHEMTIFSPGYDRQMFAQLYAYAQGAPIGLETQPLLSPANSIDALVFMKIR